MDLTLRSSKELGNGQETKEDDSVLVEVRFFLNKGKEVEAVRQRRAERRRVTRVVGTSAHLKSL
jgi:hypothetical protein